MKSLNLTVILVSFLFISCNTSQKNVPTNTENETQVASKKMLESGFIKGTIAYSEKEGDCPYTIQADEKEGAIYYDPINITEEFKSNGKTIWFKFTGLRMMNRCEKARPIRLEDIQMRH